MDRLFNMASNAVDYIFDVAHIRVNHFVPGPRSGHKCFSVGQFVGIFGGYDNNSSPTIKRELWLYDVVRNSFELIHMPYSFRNSVASSAVAVDEENMIVYVHGGSGFPFGKTSSGDLYSFDINKYIELRKKNIQLAERVTAYMKECWQMVYEYKLGERFDSPDDIDENLPPQPKYGHSMVFYRGSLYIFGGTRGFEEVNELHKFDTVTKKFQVLFVNTGALEPFTDSINEKYVPRSRYKHEAFSFGAHMFVFGGACSSGIFPISVIHKYSYGENAWDVIDTLPEEYKRVSGEKAERSPANRTSFAAALNDRTIVICGGLDEATGQFEVVNDESGNVTEMMLDRQLGVYHRMYRDFWELDLMSMRWRSWLDRGVELTDGLYFNSAAYNEDSGKLYVFGGVKSNMRQRSDSFMKIGVTPAKLKIAALAKLFEKEKKRNVRDMQFVKSIEGSRLFDRYL